MEDESEGSSSSKQEKQDEVPFEIDEAVLKIINMEDDSEGSSSPEPEKKYELPFEGVKTVFEHAVWEAERYPECSDLLIGRIFGVPSKQLHPCKTCCGLTGDPESPWYNLRNYTPEEIDNMTETCPAHDKDEEMEKYEEEMREIDRAEAVLEAQLAKKAKAAQTRLANKLKKAELEAKKKLKENTKAIAETNYTGKRASKRAKPSNPEEEKETNDEEEDDDTEYVPPSKSKKVKTKVTEQTNDKEDDDDYEYVLHSNPKKTKTKVTEDTKKDKEDDYEYVPHSNPKKAKTKDTKKDEEDDNEYVAYSKPKKAKTKVSTSTVTKKKDMNYYMYGIDTEPKPKKKTVWICPGCDRSSKYGSTGCTWCDEWWHIGCAGFKRVKDIPHDWTCTLCDIP